ncbi:MAG: cupin domain-containing protein [Hyphomicrobiales bacterium]|nr:cupin domain-containing protein [Hyphomicrobiales bacterium]
MIPFRAILFATIGLLVAITAPAVALDQGSAKYENLLTPLLSGNQTIIDQTIAAYPDGTPNITAAIVTVPAGNDTGWHIHKVPLFAYLMEGELTVDYGDKGTKLYKAGDSLLEAMNWPHNGINSSDKPVEIMVVYMGIEGTPNAEAVDAPK